MRFIKLVMGLITLALGACANNELVRQEAQRLATASDGAISRLEDFYHGWIDRDRELWLAVSAYDEQCSPPELELVYPAWTGNEICERLPDGTKQIQITRKDLSNDSLMLKFLREYLTVMPEAIAIPDANHAVDNFDNALTRGFDGSLSTLEMRATSAGGQ